MQSILYNISKNKQCIVSYNIDDAVTYEREVGGLVKFLKAYSQYSGIIITWDTESEIVVDDITINVVPVWKWLCATD